MTDKDPTDAEVKEFWEGCGWIHDIDKGIFFYKSKEKWYPPDCTDALHFRVEPPPIDLNNLFKYAVPMAIEKLQIEHKWAYRTAERSLFALWLSMLKTNEYALALFWACYPIITGKEAISVNYSEVPKL